MKKDIFLVDADDTILDFQKASANAIQDAFSYFGVQWEDRFASEYKLLNDELWERLERKELTRDRLHAIRFPLFLQKLGIFSVDGDEFNRRYLHFIASNPVYVDGAEAFLSSLNEMGRVFIVTNGTAWIQKSRFQISGLNEKCTASFVSQVVGFDKPAKEYTAYVLAHIDGFEKERAIWIGDSLSADIKAANEAEIDSVWFNPAAKKLTDKATPTYTAHNFQEILQILQTING